MIYKIKWWVKYFIKNCYLITRSIFRNDLGIFFNALEYNSSGGNEGCGQTTSIISLR